LVKKVLAASIEAEPMDWWEGTSSPPMSTVMVNPMARSQ
jgi:hypothetical protein